MSGGSFEYLCYASDVEDILGKRRQLEEMADFLAARGYAKDAAMESAELLARLRQFEVWMEVGLARLARVWKAAEWWQSGDWSEAALLEALAKYREGASSASNPPLTP